MSNPATAEALGDFPPVVFVPCNKPSERPPAGTEDAIGIEIHMRMTRDGRVALLAYSALDRFHDLAGRDSDWALLTHQGLDELYTRQPFDLLLMDVEIPVESREDGQWLNI